MIDFYYFNEGRFQVIVTLSNLEKLAIQMFLEFDTIDPDKATSYSDRIAAAMVTDGTIKVIIDDPAVSPKGLIPLSQANKKARDRAQTALAIIAEAYGHSYKIENVSVLP